NDVGGTIDLDLLVLPLGVQFGLVERFLGLVDGLDDELHVGGVANLARLVLLLGRFRLLGIRRHGGSGGLLKINKVAFFRHFVALRFVSAGSMGLFVGEF